MSPAGRQSPVILVCHVLDLRCGDGIRCFRNQLLVSCRQPTYMLEFGPSFERQSTVVDKAHAS